MKSVILPFLLLVIFILAIVIPIAVYISSEHKIKSKISQLSTNAHEITPQEFFRIRNASHGGRGRAHISKKYDFSGVYVLFNRTKNMYYIGQGVSVFQRVNQHFTGHGNGDVYVDYRNGNSFTIKLIPFANSGFSSLNALERNYIKVYNAYARGYNKTRGNRG